MSLSHRRDGRIDVISVLKRSSMAVVAGTPEDENYQVTVTPSEAEGSKALRPQIVLRLAGPLRTAVALSVRIGVLATGPALFAATAL